MLHPSDVIPLELTSLTDVHMHLFLTVWSIHAIEALPNEAEQSKEAAQGIEASRLGNA